MSTGLIPCPNCRLPLPGNLCNTPSSVTCLGCDEWVHADVFPAHFRVAAVGLKPEPIVDAGVSSCFHHEGNKAVATCDGCGRFLCALCDVDLNGQHLCPTCLGHSRTRGSHVNLETTRTVYDRAALSLALWPLLVWPITVLTAPVAVACGAYSFVRTGSLLGRSPVRATIAILVGLVQIAGWIVILINSLS